MCRAESMWTPLLLSGCEVKGVKVTAYNDVSDNSVCFRHFEEGPFLFEHDKKKWFDESGVENLTGLHRALMSTLSDLQCPNIWMNWTTNNKSGQHQCQSSLMPLWLDGSTSTQQ